MKLDRILLLGLFSLGTSACVGPLVDVKEVDAETAANLREQVAIMSEAQVATVPHSRLGQVGAVSCKLKLWDPPATEEDATNQVLSKAAELGGNAIAGLACEERAEADLSINCWQSVTCRASVLILD